ncbi:hypothetical protein E2C01_052991 [Portunus trituberculatus]|uniref:Uncharacterized protein n=1 Tax=Portunus trituberculatus TaxID=210409 RepID=A0A5B7GN96_PORTR|nr:hypothetical protein [Portunus trituberculatus]
MPPAPLARRRHYDNFTQLKIDRGNSASWLLEIIQVGGRGRGALPFAPISPRQVERSRNTSSPVRDLREGGLGLLGAPHLPDVVFTRVAPSLPRPPSPRPPPSVSVLNSPVDDTRGRGHLSLAPRGGAGRGGEGVAHSSGCRLPPRCLREALHYPGFPSCLGGPLIKRTLMESWQDPAQFRRHYFTLLARLVLVGARHGYGSDEAAADDGHSRAFVKKENFYELQ